MDDDDGIVERGDQYGKICNARIVIGSRLVPSGNALTGCCGFGECSSCFRNAMRVKRLQPPLGASVVRR